MGHRTHREPVPPGWQSLLARSQCQRLKGGARLYPVLLEALGSAERSIWIGTPRIDTRAVGQLFAQVLAEASGRGVRVKVFYGARRTLSLYRSVFSALREQGVDIRRFRPLRASRRRLWVVDEAVAFLGTSGGVLRVEGPAAQALAQWLASRWRRAFWIQLLKMGLALQISAFWGWLASRGRWAWQKVQCLRERFALEGGHELFASRQRGA